MAEAAPQASLIPLRSRRAVLAGALGGIGALAATAIGGASRARASAGDPLIIGSESNNAGTANTQLQTNSSVVAFKLLQNGPGTALMGYVTPTTGATRGVYGRTDSPDGDGVQARNTGAHGTGAAIRAFGGQNVGVRATTDNVAAIYGSSDSGEGVLGISYSDAGVYGISTTNYAGFFQGRLRVTQYVDIAEMSPPAAPLFNNARLFVRDNAGKTQLCVKFPDGTFVVIASQP